VYVNDYALVVEMGGDDQCFNNAGGNLLDVKRGPAGSPALEKAPARGCEHAFEITTGECVPSAALVLDLAGNDRYGRLEPPDPNVDGLCTQDPLVRRFGTIGSGVVGCRDRDRRRGE
jgi:hypothetical protein